MAKKRAAKQIARKPKGQQSKRPSSSSGVPSWEQRFKELERFKKEYGHCNVSTKYQANPALARWVASLRHRKKDGTLARDKIRLLDALGFCWERKPTVTKAMAAVWKQRINDLKSFKKEHGHCNVPAHYPPNRPLGSWVQFTRSQKKAGRLTKERIRCLEDLGFCWVVGKRSVRRHDWNVMLAALAAFTERYGHCNVPWNWSEDPRLIPWLAKLRRKKREGKLDRGQISQLDRLGIVWEPPPKPSWSEMYAALVEYKRVHGDCNVPYDWSEPPYLGLWTRKQRHARNVNRLEQDRIEQLDKLGLVWSWHEHQWELNYAALIEFRKEYGHCRVSTLSKTHASLANWVRTERVKKRQGKLNAEQIRRLDMLEFTWDMPTPRIHPRPKGGKPK